MPTQKPRLVKASQVSQAIEQTNGPSEDLTKPPLLLEEEDAFNRQLLLNHDMRLSFLENTAMQKSDNEAVTELAQMRLEVQEHIAILEAGRQENIQKSTKRSRTKDEAARQ